MSIYSGNPNYKLEINTPALEYFKFRGGYMGKIVFLHKLDNLLHANVDINNDNTHDKEWEDLWYADRVFKLLAALQNDKFLKIYPYVSNVREVPFSYLFIFLINANKILFKSSNNWMEKVRS